jgi:hypothetical protein
MSEPTQNLPILRIQGSRRPANDPAPTARGRRRGYFKDRESRLLLGLNKGDFLRADGTYGDKELADKPVDFDLLRDGSYDRRLLPFVPKVRGTMRRVLVDLREQNRQWMPASRSVKELKETLERLGIEAEGIARQTTLPLPEYAYQILPLLLYKLTSTSGAFEFQFQPWFDPEALHARWHRIERVAGQLEGYINIGHRLLNPESRTWRHGEPVGVELDSDTADPADRNLALAYNFFAVPIALSPEWHSPENYTLLDARKAFLDNVLFPASPRFTFPTITELPEDHYDGLTFSVVHPQYSEARYNADGTRTTKRQRKLQEEGESSDMATGEDSINSDDDLPYPPARIFEDMEEIRPGNVTAVTTGEPSSSAASSRAKPLAPHLHLDTQLTPPTLPSNPTSASVSTHVSATSSASLPSISVPSEPGSTSELSRDQRQRLRASNPSASRRTERRPRTSSAAWDAYFRGQEARGVVYEQARPAPPERTSSRVIAPRAATAAMEPARTLANFQVLETRSQHMIIHDSSSNQLVEAQIPSLDFSRSAALQAVLRPQAATPSESRSRAREASPERSEQSRYRRRSPSPLDYSRDRRYDDRRYEERRYSNRPEERQFEPRRHEERRYSERRQDDRRSDDRYVHRRHGERREGDRRQRDPHEEQPPSASGSTSSPAGWARPSKENPQGSWGESENP